MQSTPQFKIDNFHSIQPSSSSCYVTETDIARVGFILTMHDAKDVAVFVIVEEQVRVTRVLLLAVFIGTVTWLIIGGKVSDIMSLIS